VNRSGTADAPGASDAPAADIVLYVEDDANNVRLVQRIFRTRPKLELQIATTGAAGLLISGQTSLRLILLDRHLPDMTGNDFLRRLIAQDPAARTPVVVTSGDTDHRTIAEFKQLGVMDYLIKPYDLTQLLALVDKYCGTYVTE
jgi:DNA-binding response OmpR family regulator